MKLHRSLATLFPQEVTMMRKSSLLQTASFAFAAALGVACSSTASPQHDHAASASTGKTATAVVQGKAGSKVAGKVTFEETADGVIVVADFTGASGPGPHGFHLHEVGECTPPDFTTAGSHFNPTAAPHGARDAAQHHAGDFGNIEIKADGSGHLEFTSRSITVAPGASSVVGRAVILHEKADDLTTQPTGNAGGRIGCGVVKADG
jgi:Cu-Zn family superoxide dismutase